MYLGGESKVLSIKDKVSAIIYVETFIIKLVNQVISQLLNHLIKTTWDFKAPPRFIYLARKSTQFY